MKTLDPTPIYTETVKDHPELFSKPTEAVEEVHVGEPREGQRPLKMGGNAR